MAEAMTQRSASGRVAAFTKPKGATMHRVVHEYVEPVKMPADPLAGDLCIHRVSGDSVYSILPMTATGRSFVLEHHELGSAHGDLLLVPSFSIVPFMDDVFDEGLRVV